MTAINRLADHLEIFLGMTNPAMAHVYARLADSSLDPSSTLAGTLTGPTCRYADTLPATFMFADLGPGDGILSRAVVPEPSYWTPEQPHCYQADIRLRDAQGEAGQVARMLGIRPLGAHNQDLILAGQRWVPRGVSANCAAESQLEDWHQAGAVMLVDEPTELLCAEASRAGVLIVARLTTLDAQDLTRLQRWPAVGMIVAPHGTAAPSMPVRNVLLGECFSRHDVIRPADWAQIVLCEAGGNGIDASQMAECQVPALAYRPVGQLTTVAEGRALCDALQRDLAGEFSWAGYIV